MSSVVKGIRLFFRTMLEIIEDRPNFLIGDSMYVLSIAFYFFQISGYIFCTTQTKYIKEKIFMFFGHINEVSTGTFLLSMKGADSLTMIFFGIIFTLIIGQYIYIISLTIAKTHYKKFVKRHSRWITKCNQILNLFFTFYYWIFQTPFLEINVAIMACTNNSFITTYRAGDGCQTRSFLIPVLSIFGQILSIFTGIMIMFFFRNYAFFERNFLKRKFNAWQMPQLFSYFLFLYIYYLQNGNDLIKNYAGQIVGFIQIADLIINYPFRNRIVSVAYSIGVSYYYVSVTVIFIWLQVDSLKDTDLFYSIAFIILLLGFLFYAVQQYQLEQILLLNDASFPKLYRFLDFYLEELVRLGIDQQKNEFNRFKLFQLLGNHQQTCDQLNCKCKQTTFKDQKGNLIYDDLLGLVDDIFKRYISMPIINKNNYEREHICLKYISFMANFRHNPVRAYYKLKYYLSVTPTKSLYFESIERVLSAQIEKLINDTQGVHYESTQSKVVLASAVKEEISIKEVEHTFLIKEMFLPLIKEFLQSKIVFWAKATLGHSSISSFYEEAIRFSKKSTVLRKNFRDFLTHRNKHIHFQDNAIVCKILSIYHMIVMNQHHESFKYETEFLGQRKRDFSKSKLIINQFNLTHNLVVILRMSISEDRGKLLGAKTSSTASFFGFPQKEFEKITKVNELMPEFISSVHDDLINNLLNRGFSDLVRGKRQTFCIDFEGFIFPINLYLEHLFGGSQNDYCMFGMLLKLTTASEYVVFDGFGNILGITRKLFYQVAGFRSEKIRLVNLIRQACLLKTDPQKQDGIIDLNEFQSRINIFGLMPDVLSQLDQSHQLDKAQASAHAQDKMAILEGEEHYGSLKLFHSCFHLSEEINKKLKVNAHNNISAEPTTTTEELAKFIKMTTNNYEHYSRTDVKYKISKTEIWHRGIENTLKLLQYYVLEVNSMKDESAEKWHQEEQNYEITSIIEGSLDKHQRNGYLTQQHHNPSSTGVASNYLKPNEIDSPKSRQEQNSQRKYQQESVFTPLILDKFPLSESTGEAKETCSSPQYLKHSMDIAPSLEINLDSSIVHHIPSLNRISHHLISNPQWNQDNKQVSGQPQLDTSINTYHSMKNIPAGTPKNRTKKNKSLSVFSLNPPRFSEIEPPSSIEIYGSAPTSPTQNGFPIINNEYDKQQNFSSEQGKYLMNVKDKNNNSTRNQNNNDLQGNSYLNISIRESNALEDGGSSSRGFISRISDNKKDHYLVKQQYSQYSPRHQNTYGQGSFEVPLNSVNQQPEHNYSQSSQFHFTKPEVYVRPRVSSLTKTATTLNRLRNPNKKVSIIETIAAKSRQVSYQSIEIPSVPWKEPKNVSRNYQKMTKIHMTATAKNQMFKEDNDDPDVLRSQSYKSHSSSFRSDANQLIKSIIMHNSRTFSALISIFAMCYLLYFAAISICGGVVVLLEMSYLNTSIASAVNKSNGYTIISNQTLNVIAQLEIQYAMLDDDPQSSIYNRLESSCEDNQQRFINSFYEDFPVYSRINSDNGNIPLTTYSNTLEQPEQTHKFIEVLYLLFQASLSMCISTSKTYKDHLFFLLKNINTIQTTLSTNTNNYLFKDMSNNQDALSYRITVLWIGCLLVTLVLCFLGGICVAVLSKYKLRILQLICRISLGECEIEVSGFKKLLLSMSSSDQHWLDTDFVQIMNQDQELENRKRTQNIQAGKITNNETNKQPQVKVNSVGVSSGQSSRRLITLIVTQSDFPAKLKSVGILSLVLSTGSIVFIVLLVVLQTQLSKLDTTLVLFKDVIAKTHDFSHTLMISEYVLMSKTIQFQPLADQTFPKLMLSESLAENVQKPIVLVDSALKYLHSEAQSLSDTSLEQINDLIQNDLCLSDSSGMINCLGFQDSLKAILKQGMSGVFTEYSSLYNSHSSFYTNMITTNTDWQAIRAFMNSQDHTDYFRNGFKLAVILLQDLTSVVESGIAQSLDNSKYLWTMLFCGICIPFVIIWIGGSWRIQKEIEEEMQNLNFCLTLIPYNKLEDENIILFLKRIKTFW